MRAPVRDSLAPRTVRDRSGSGIRADRAGAAPPRAATDRRRSTCSAAAVSMSTIAGSSLALEIFNDAHAARRSPWIMKPWSRSLPNGVRRPAGRTATAASAAASSGGERRWLAPQDVSIYRGVDHRCGRIGQPPRSHPRLPTDTADRPDAPVDFSITTREEHACDLSARVAAICATGLHRSCFAAPVAGAQPTRSRRRACLQRVRRRSRGRPATPPAMSSNSAARTG